MAHSHLVAVFWKRWNEFQLAYTSSFRLGLLNIYITFKQLQEMGTSPQHSFNLRFMLSVHKDKSVYFNLTYTFNV